MEISENIRHILDPSAEWKLYKNRSYRAGIQTADKDSIYNVPDRPGVVYNFLEESYENVAENGYVITGILGEMWPVGAATLKKYDVRPEDITDTTVYVNTVELDTVYAAVMIPKDVQFTLRTDYGEKALLNGNRPCIDHHEGDYIVVAAKLVNSVYVPDTDDCGRIVNGAVFSRLYKPYDAEI